MILDENGYIEACNQVLRSIPEFEDGMEIISVPFGGFDPSLSGYGWIGPPWMGAIVSKVVNTVKKDHYLCCTQH
jgi:hypothetical protein